MLRSHKSAAAAISTMGAMAAALVLTAPSAPAAINAFAVTPGDPLVFVTGCAYTALATTEPGSWISFYDSQDGEFNPPSAIQAGGNGDVIAKWTPHTPGMHMLHAAQIGGERTIGIEVSPGGNGTPCPA
ncbi:hypothetical protein [Nocardia arthritidis]|uniref:Ig-like domain repeat protein n=1 Tax=Nocardia arthritidis TaxID=228602 RepID=A0A6G9YSG2_9NOCA|nr:hypothetical protein [Nocardia arthritidis]QIS16255.1 hypothetical protein F5544_42230 [Nocardia arthritidis]